MWLMDNIKSVQKTKEQIATEEAERAREEKRRVLEQHKSIASIRMESAAGKGERKCQAAEFKGGLLFRRRRTRLLGAIEIMACF